MQVHGNLSSINSKNFRIVPGIPTKPSGREPAHFVYLHLPRIPCERSFFINSIIHSFDFQIRLQNRHIILFVLHIFAVYFHYLFISKDIMSQTTSRAPLFQMSLSKTSMSPPPLPSASNASTLSQRYVTRETTLSCIHC